MKRRLLSDPRSRRAFTLVEMLVSMGVLAILVVIISQLLNSATGVITAGTKHLDADSEARMILDRMAFDLGGIVKRPDVDYYFKKRPGNDQMAFYSEVTGYHPAGLTESTAKSPICVVGYRVEDDMFQRLGKGLIWNGVTTSTSGAAGWSGADKPMIFGVGSPEGKVLSDAYPSITTPGLADPDQQVLGSQIFRFEFCYLLKNGTLSENPYIAPHTTTNGLKDVSAIVVALALLDSKSRVIVTNLAGAAQELDDVSGPVLTNTPGKMWRNKIDTGTSFGLARVAASQIRIYERFFYINPTQEDL